MIEKLDAKECSGLAKAASYLGVMVGRTRIAGGMIVSDDDLRRRVNDRTFEYFSRMNEALGQCSDGDDLALNFLIPGVEVKHDEMFFFEESDIGTSLPNIFRRKEKKRFFVSENPSSEFETSDDFAGFCGTDAEVVAEFFDADGGKSFSAIASQKTLTDLNGTVSARSRAKNDRKEFRGAHFSGSVSNELFARSIDRGKIGNF